ncbi:hypothetical protein TrVFT333_003360 [Trichoderma virens FT-333]|nr:hypothetical protein TrVFT333_003360 [Trichoderma virens FT-333]
MAWRCSGSSNAGLVANMWTHGLITEPLVKEAFLKVDRRHYAPGMPYQDSPQPIGYEATISAPHMHASAIENVLSRLLPSETSPAPRVLDIGSGSGYLTHIFAELVGDRGLVGKKLLEAGIAKFVVGDGRLGWVEAARAGEEQLGTAWDVIHVGAAAKEVHSPLLEQLKAPGCMFIPVDDDSTGWDQSVWRIEKDEEGKVTRKKLFGVRYVPLTDPQGAFEDFAAI